MNLLSGVVGFGQIQDKKERSFMYSSDGRREKQSEEVRGKKNPITKLTKKKQKKKQNHLTKTRLMNDL